MTEDLRQSLRRAMLEASSRRHEYVTLEHLLLSLCADPVGAKALQAVGVRLPRLVRELEEFLEQQLETLPPVLPADAADETAGATSAEVDGAPDGQRRARFRSPTRKTNRLPSRRSRSGGSSNGRPCTPTAPARANWTPAL